MKGCVWIADGKASKFCRMKLVNSAAVLTVQLPESEGLRKNYYAIHEMREARLDLRSVFADRTFEARSTCGK